MFAVDASYTKPLQTNFLMLGPTYVLLTIDQVIGRYYMVSRAYSSGKGVVFDNTTTTSILEYEGSYITSVPSMPNIPFYNNTQNVTSFVDGLRSLASQEHPVFVP
jgi:laccase